MRAADAALADPGAQAEAWRAHAAARDALVGQALQGADERAGRADGPGAATSAAARRRLERRVLAHAGEALLLHRAWFAPFGFEARPERVPGLDELLERAARGAAPGR